MLRISRRRRFPRFEVEQGGYTPEWREPNGAAGSCDTGVGGSGGDAGGVRRAGRMVDRRLSPGARAGARRHTRAWTGVATPVVTSIAPVPRREAPLRIVLSTIAGCA